MAALPLMECPTRTTGAGARKSTSSQTRAAISANAEACQRCCFAEAGHVRCNDPVLSFQQCDDAVPLAMRASEKVQQKENPGRHSAAHDLETEAYAHGRECRAGECTCFRVFFLPWNKAAKQSAVTTTAQSSVGAAPLTARFGEPCRCNSASTQPDMSELPILQNVEVAARTSEATRRVLTERAAPASYTPYLDTEHMAMLRSLVDAILPQAAIGTEVNIAEAIDRRLSAGENAGWRFAVLPPDGEAYRQGLTALHTMLQQTPMKTFERMPVPAREGYLRCVANGDVDGPAGFPLSTFLKVLRTDVVRFWIAHPDAMRVMGYFGFADGATGNEGWQAIGPNSALPFEYEGAMDQATTAVSQSGAADKVAGKATDKADAGQAGAE